MPANDERLQLRCPNCDRVVANIPRDYHFEDDHLVCPGCAAEVEVPDEPAVLRAFRQAAASILGRLRRRE